MSQLGRRFFLIFNQRLRVNCQLRYQGQLTSKSGEDELISNAISTSKTLSYNFLHTNDSNIEDSDVFGQLAEKHGVKVFNLYPESELEDGEDRPFIPFREKKSAFGFFYECKKLRNQGKLDECVQLLIQTMLKEQRVKPLESNFSVVIGALGRSGDVARALMVFNKLKDHGLTPTAPSYTALFNAFANSPNADLNALQRIYQRIPDKVQTLNRISYNALLKAHAKHDSLQNCLSIFRDSIVAGYEPDVYTFSHIMLSCGNDLQNGSRHAIQLFRLMMNLDIKPSGQFLLHFLQVLSKCDIGNIAEASKVLLEHKPENLKYFMKNRIRNFRWLKGQVPHPNPINFENEESKSSEPLQLLGSTGLDPLEDEELNSIAADSSTILKKSSDSYDAQLQVVQNSGFNLLELKSVPELLSIRPCPKPSDRLNLVGGIESIFKMTKDFKIKPNLKLLTVMISLLEENCEAEDAFMRKVEKMKIKLDADFYNFVMIKRAKRKNHMEARNVLQRMQDLNISPNYRTWCIHAMSCHNFHAGKKLIEQVIDAEMHPNAVLFSTLIHATLHNAKNETIAGYKDVHYPNYRYLSYLVNQMKKFKVPANNKLIANLENAAAWPENYNRWKVSDSDFEKKIARFRKHYNEWLKSADCE